jgi:hypothetical protein
MTYHNNGLINRIRQEQKSISKEIIILKKTIKSLKRRSKLDEQFLEKVQK